MFKTSAKYILQIKSAFLRLNSIYTDIAGYMLSHVKKFWWIQETAVEQSISSCLSCHRPVTEKYWTNYTIVQIHIYLKAAFLYHKIPLSSFEKKKQKVRWSNTWKWFLIRITLSSYVYHWPEWELQSLQSRNFPRMGDQMLTALSLT